MKKLVVFAVMMVLVLSAGFASSFEGSCADYSIPVNLRNEIKENFVVYFVGESADLSFGQEYHPFDYSEGEFLILPREGDNGWFPREQFLCRKRPLIAGGGFLQMAYTAGLHSWPMGLPKFVMGRKDKEVLLSASDSPTELRWYHENSVFLAETPYGVRVDEYIYLASTLELCLANMAEAFVLLGPEKFKKGARYPVVEFVETDQGLIYKIQSSDHAWFVRAEHVQLDLFLTEKQMYALTDFFVGLSNRGYENMSGERLAGKMIDDIQKGLQRLFQALPYEIEGSFESFLREKGLLIKNSPLFSLSRFDLEKLDSCHLIWLAKYIKYMAEVFGVLSHGDLKPVYDLQDYENRCPNSGAKFMPEPVMTERWDSIQYELPGKGSYFWVPTRYLIGFDEE